jgi:hypothetical protein
MISSRSIWAGLAITWKKKRPAGGRGFLAARRDLDVLTLLSTTNISIISIGQIAAQKGQSKTMATELVTGVWQLHLKSLNAIAAATGITVNAGATGISTANAGGGNPLNVMQPFIAFHKIIRT